MRDMGQVRCGICLTLAMYVDFTAITIHKCVCFNLVNSHVTDIFKFVSLYEKYLLIPSQILLNFVPTIIRSVLAH